MPNERQHPEDLGGQVAEDHGIVQQDILDFDLFGLKCVCGFTVKCRPHQVTEYWSHHIATVAVQAAYDEADNPSEVPDEHGAYVFTYSRVRIPRFGWRCTCGARNGAPYRLAVSAQADAKVHLIEEHGVEETEPPFSVPVRAGVREEPGSDSDASSTANPTSDANTGDPSDYGTDGTRQVERSLLVVRAIRTLIDNRMEFFNDMEKRVMEGGLAAYLHASFASEYTEAARVLLREVTSSFGASPTDDPC